jgi:hypothetical protein
MARSGEKGEESVKSGEWGVKGDLLRKSLGVLQRLSVI